MFRVDTYDRYKEYIIETKSRVGKTVSNDYMFREQVERYIGLGRLYVEEVEAGCLFYSDEDTHYRCYFYLNPSLNMKVCKKDKLVLAQVIYPNARTNGELTGLLENGGFRLSGVMDYIQNHPETAMEKLKKPMKAVEKLFEQNKLHYRTLEQAQLSEFVSLQGEIQNIPYYELAYYTEEEYLQMIEKGWLLCVVNEKHEICAVRQFECQNKMLHSWYAIKESYQKEYGIAIMFMYHSFKYALENGVKKIYGWVRRDNRESIKFHKKLGFEWTDRMMEEWTVD
ncbi:MAG: GNAT family N-acetyltransferase [Roseburia sp.]|nr:GNAT family N-acetyltransferase [Roseburia sp.]